MSSIKWGSETPFLGEACPPLLPPAPSLTNIAEITAIWFKATCVHFSWAKPQTLALLLHQKTIFLPGSRPRVSSSLGDSPLLFLALKTQKPTYQHSPKRLSQAVVWFGLRKWQTEFCTKNRRKKRGKRSFIFPPLPTSIPLNSSSRPGWTLPG